MPICPHPQLCGLHKRETCLARLGDGAVDSAPYRGMVRTALGIVQEEGFLKLWQGVTPAIYRHVGIYLDSSW